MEVGTIACNESEDGKESKDGNANKDRDDTPIVPSAAKKLRITNRTKYIDSAGIRARTNDDDTALSLAMSGGHAGVVELLLDQGITLPSRPPGIIQKQFIVSATKGQLEMCRLLLRKCGADVNGRLRAHGDTALTICAYNNNVDACKFLLSQGADPTISQRYDNPAPLCSHWLPS